MATFTLFPYEKNNLKIQVSSEIHNIERDIYLSFRLTDPNSEIDLGEYRVNHERRLNLWEKTCFEFFIKNNHDEYFELNFAPNFAWNVFYFQKKGAPLVEFQLKHPISMDVLNSSDHFLLVVKIDKENFGTFFNDINKLRFSMTSVIKDKNSKLSYWALTHKDSRPNFHHFDSFIGSF
jgi:hypothetical protein